MGMPPRSMRGKPRIDLGGAQKLAGDDRAQALTPSRGRETGSAVLLIRSAIAEAKERPFSAKQSCATKQGSGASTVKQISGAEDPDQIIGDLACR